MKLTLEEHFASASGRIRRNNETYNRTNRHTGQVVAVKLCNPYSGPSTRVYCMAQIYKIIFTSSAPRSVKNH